MAKSANPFAASNALTRALSVHARLTAVPYPAPDDQAEESVPLSRAEEQRWPLFGPSATRVCGGAGRAEGRHPSPATRTLEAVKRLRSDNGRAPACGLDANGDFRP